jgi:uncharacterized protein DUF6675
MSLLFGARTMLAFALCACAGAARAQAADEPRAPCEGAAPVPAYAAPDAPPAVRTWTDPAWIPPACLGWPPERSRLIVALAGRFRHAGDAQTLLARFGAISSMRGLQYWSVTDKAWRELITDGAALTGPGSGSRRPDFSPAELATGATVYFEQKEGRTSAPVVYRLRVLEAGAARVAIATENVTPVRAFLVTLFPPGSLRATYLIERRGADVWSFYGISSTSAEASALASVSPPSYINRAAALYGQFAGIPAQRHPPPAP